MSQVNTELGLSSTTSQSINNTRVRLLANDPSGSIAMSNFYGKQVPTIMNTGVGSPVGTTAQQTYYDLYIGPQTSDRTIICLAAGVSGTGGRPLYTLRVNGEYMTQVNSVYTNNSGTASAAIFALRYTRGGDYADFILDTGGNQSPYIQVLAVYGLNSDTPYSSGSSISPGTSVPISASLNQQYDGISVGAASSRSYGGGFTSGITQQTSTDGLKFFGWDTNTTLQTITCAFEDNSSTGAMCVASFR